MTFLVVPFAVALTIASCSDSDAASPGSDLASPDGGVAGPGPDPNASSSSGGPSPAPEAGAPGDAAAPADFWDARDIPPAKNVMVFKFLNRSNGVLKDSEIYWRFKTGALTELHSIA